MLTYIRPDFYPHTFYSHELGVQRHFIFWPRPWGPGEGSKGQISFNFIYKVNFKDFLYQTLCVFSQMKDAKHIRQDIHSVAWVMPWGPGGTQGVKKIFQAWSCEL